MEQIFSISFSNIITGSLPPRGATAALSDSSGLTFHETRAKPITATNDSQRASGESTERHRTAALWQLPECAVVRTHEASVMLSRSVRTLQNWRYKRKGPSYQLGRTVTYRIGDLRAYVEGCTVSVLNSSK